MKSLRSIGSLISMGYFIIASIAGPYYFWQYSKANGFIKTITFGTIVSSFKAVAWPAVVVWDYTHSDGVEIPRESIQHFKDSRSLVSKIVVNNVRAVILKGSDNKPDFEKIRREIINDLDTVLIHIKQIDVSLLKSGNLAFGTLIEDKYIPGVLMLDKALREENSEAAQLAAQKIDDFSRELKILGDKEDAQARENQ